MQQSSSFSQKIFIYLIVIFVLLEGLFFIRIFPKYQIPDEERYVRNVMSLSEGEIPYFRATSYTGHPILYEALIYPLFKTLDFNMFYRAARLISLFFYISTIIIAFYTTKLLFEESKILPIFVACLLAFSPQLNFILSSLNSDSMLMFIFSASSLVLLRIYKQKHTYLDYILLLILLIAGFLTKERFVVIVPYIIFVAVSQLMRYFKSYKKQDSLRRATIFGSIIVVFAYFANSFTSNYLRQEIDMLSYVTKFSFNGIIRICKQFWWGHFGLLQHPWPKEIYLIAGVITVFAIIGLILFLRKETTNSKTKRWLFLFLSITIVMLVFVIFYEIKTMSGQARHLNIIIIPIYVLVAVGLNEFVRRLKIERISVPVILSLMLIVNLYSLVFRTGWLIG